MRRAALLLLGLGSPLLLLTLLIGGSRAGVLFALLSLLFPTALCIAGAARRGGGTAWRWVLPVLGLVLLLSGAGLLLFDARGDAGLRLLGLPPAALLLLGGLGLLPLLLTGFGYAADHRGAVRDERPAPAEAGSVEPD